MSLLIQLLLNLGIIGVIIYAGFSGARRGLVLVGLEDISFIIATVFALFAYHPVGGAIKSLAHITVALGNVAAFVLLWVMAEITCAVIVRYALSFHHWLPSLKSLTSRIGGATLGAIKTDSVITLALIVYGGLPLSVAAKRPVTGGYVASRLIAATGNVSSIIAAGLGHDLNESLNFYTVTAEPESEQTIQLGFTTTAVSVDEADEVAMLVLLNHERTTRGLQALTLNTKARTVARAYSTEMFARGFFSHISPEGKNPFDRMRAAGISFDSAGENLALAPTLALAHEGLMKSPGHRANILSVNYRTVGIGIINGGPYGLMVTQDFTD